MWPIFQRLLPPIYGGGASSNQNEQRLSSLATCKPTDIWGLPSGGSGVDVSMHSALSVPAVWDAVKKVSETLASLPFDLFKKTDEGSAPAMGHAVRYLVRTEPSPNVTSYDLRRALFARACFGDAFLRIHRNGIGRPVRLELMKGNVYVGETDEGGAFYVWYWKRGSKTGTETLLPQEVVHIKGFSLDGVKGLDVSEVHRDSLGFAIAANKYGSKFFANNAGVDKVLAYPQPLTPLQMETVQRNIAAKSGTDRVGSTMVLDGGAKLEKIGLSPEEAMLNESRNFQVNEVARVFGVPVHLLQNMDRATFNNIEMMTTLFVTLCLRPWAIQMEQEFAMKLLTRDEKESDTLFFRHNFEGLLRGDTASRASFYASGILNGWITRNEVREKENLNTLEGLDKPLVPVNMSIIDEDGTVETQTQEQGQTNPPKPGQPGSGGTKQDDGTPQSST